MTYSDMIVKHMKYMSRSEDSPVTFLNNFSCNPGLFEAVRCSAHILMTLLAMSPSMMKSVLIFITTGIQEKKFGFKYTGVYVY